MIKFLLILLIFIKIIEIIYAGKNDAGPSKKEKGKRKLDKFLEENLSNSNESLLIEYPSANGLREGMLLPIRNVQSSKLLASSINDENIQHSLMDQQEMIDQNHLMQEPAIIAEIGNGYQIIDTSQEIHHQGDQQFFPEISTRFHRNNNPNPNPNQSSHRTLLPIPQFEVYSDPSPNPGQSTSHQTFPPIPQFEENSYLNEIQGQQSGFNIQPSMGYHGVHGNSIDQSTGPIRILGQNALNLSNSSILKIQQSMDIPLGKNIDKGKNPMHSIEEMLSTNKDDTKKFQCRFSECNKKFAHHSNRYHHERTHRPNFIPFFKCTWPGCQKEYKYKGNLREHEETHQTNFIPFKSTWPGCQKEYKYNTNRLNHEKTHQKSVVCENCGNKFKLKRYLDEHLKKKRCIKDGNNII